MSALFLFRRLWLGGRWSCPAALPFSFWTIACCGLCLLNAAVVAIAADVGSNSTAEPQSSASQYVTRALQAEAEGNLVERDRLLALAAKTDARCEAAQWQLGYLRVAGRWQSIEDCLATTDGGTSLDAYEARRLIALDNSASQWELALWCTQNRHPDQARAHARRTIELEPNHVAARRLLGFRYVDGQWISAAEWNQFERRTADVQRGLEKYGEQLIEVARGFRAHKAEARGSARDQLMEISDPIAIAPVEGIVGSADTEAAQAALRWLARIPDPEASRSMVRFAMFYPGLKTRQLATSQLRERPYHDYVPELLQMLSSPVASMSLPVVDRNGTLRGFRQAFAQERQGQTEVFVLDTRMNYSATGPRNSVRLQSQDSAPRDLMSQLEAIERAGQRVNENATALRANNQRILVRNQRIAEVLSDVTNREFSGSPNELWAWWDEVNETEYQAMKLSNVRYASTELATRNYTELASAAIGSTRVSHECFARGTPVITRRGPRPIESLRVGDLVLSRDVPTGELSWKPVVRTTTRPPRPIYEITLDDESLQCTGGHLFWVSGQGWTKASQLKGGDVLHGAASPAVVMKIVQRADEPTYNLAVEATQTYFVGKQMVLSHDVTDRVPTYIKVPGLAPVAAQ